MTAEDGGRAQQLLTFLKLLPALVFVWCLSFAFWPIKTLRDTRQIIRGEYSSEYSNLLNAEFPIRPAHDEYYPPREYWRSFDDE